MKLSLKLIQNTNGMNIELFSKKPERCPECGCEKIYSNGHYYIKGEKVRKALRIKNGGKVKVQMFVCAHCGKYIKTKPLNVKIEKKQKNNHEL
jgi:hypothetical protein